MTDARASLPDEKVRVAGVIDARPLLAQRDGRVLVLSLARPPTNAIDEELLSALGAAFATVEGDIDIRATILTSAIPGIFSSGGDLRFWQSYADASYVSKEGRDVIQRLAGLPVLTVAMIDGRVIGDALAFARTCDIRIASPRAMFQLPETALGFIPGWGTVHRLVEMVGRGNASAMLLLGKTIDAAKALRIGLVNEIIDERDIFGRAMSIASQAEALSPRALQAARCALRGGDERSCFAAVWGSDDWSEGVSSLLEKRRPVFRRAATGGCCT